MSGRNNKDSSNTPTEEQGRPASMHRRALLKGAATTMPMILTLQSGAALARSSNLIGPASAGTRDLNGYTLCLDTDSVIPLEYGNKYDLGDPAYATINMVSDHDYYPEANRSHRPPYGPDYVCMEGGEYYYQDRGWQEVTLPTNGIVVSAMAVASVSAHGNILFNKIA